MEARDGVEPAAVLESMGLRGDGTIEPLLGGADAQLWRVTVDGTRCALRVLRPSQHEQARREVGVHRRMESTDVPVPRIVATALAEERPAYLMEWVDGHPLAEKVLDPETPPRRRRDLMARFGEMQAAVHELPAGDLAADSDRVLRTGRVPADDVPRRDPTARLLHLDYHPGNVLVRGGRIVAVLDWANAAADDPRYDRARTESQLALHPDPRMRRDRLRQDLLDSWRAGYGAHEGLEPAFRRWAGAAMLTDLSPRLEDPAAPWVTAELLERIRCYH